MMIGHRSVLIVLLLFVVYTLAEDENGDAPPSDDQQSPDQPKDDGNNPDGEAGPSDATGQQEGAEGDAKTATDNAQQDGDGKDQGKGGADTEATAKGKDATADPSKKADKTGDGKEATSDPSKKADKTGKDKGAKEPGKDKKTPKKPAEAGHHGGGNHTHPNGSKGVNPHEVTKHPKKKSPVTQANKALKLLKIAGLLGENGPTIPAKGIGKGALTAINTLHGEQHGLMQATFHALKKGGLGQLRRNEALESHPHLIKLRDEANKHPKALQAINAHIKDYVSKHPPGENKKKQQKKAGPA